MDPKYYLILIPIIAVYTTGYYFPVKYHDDKKNKFKPPAIIGNYIVI